MLIAQALGEYGVMSALISGVDSLYYWTSESLGEWGWTGAGLIVATLIVWGIVVRVK